MLQKIIIISALISLCLAASLNKTSKLKVKKVVITAPIDLTEISYKDDQIVLTVRDENVEIDTEEAENDELVDSKIIQNPQQISEDKFQPKLATLVGPGCKISHDVHVITFNVLSTE